MEKYFLNELEKSELTRFSENEVLFNAVKKVLLHEIYGQGKLEEGKDPEEHINWVFSLYMNEMGQEFKQTNEELGEKVRACIEGIRTVQLAFKKIKELRPIVIIEKPKTNEAR